MDVTYDIVMDLADGQKKEFLDSFIPSQAEALDLLAKQRKRYPTAYLERVIRVRCLEPWPQKGRKRASNRTATASMC